MFLNCSLEYFQTKLSFLFMNFLTMIMKNFFIT